MNNKTVDLEHLKLEVQRAGRIKNDSRSIEDLVVFKNNDKAGFCIESFGVEMNVSATLFVSVRDDLFRGDRFWDGLGTWINYFHNNPEYAYVNDIPWLTAVAQAYIDE